jgi:hypothetical protein
MRRLVRFITVTMVALTAFSAGQARAGALVGDLIVTDFSAYGGNGGVIIVHPVTGVQTMLSSGGFFRDPWDVAIDPNNNPPRIFVTDIVADAIIEVNPNTGLQTLRSAGGLITNPTGVEIGPGTDLYVTDSGTASLLRVDKNTGAQALLYAGPPFLSPFGVAVNKFGTVYVLDRLALGGAVFEMVGGVPVPISVGAPFVQPYGITTDGGAPDFPANEPGGIWVVDRNAAGGNGALIYVDPNTGVKTIESQAQNFADPSGVSIGVPPNPNQIFCCDYLRARVCRADPALAVGANQTLISSGGDFRNPVKLAAFPEQPVQTEATTWGRVKGKYR